MVTCSMVASPLARSSSDSARYEVACSYRSMSRVSSASNEELRVLI